MPEIKRKPKATAPTKSKCIGIVGTRCRDGAKDEEACFNEFVKHNSSQSDTIVSGGCTRGGDRFAQAFARHYGHSITIHYPETDDFGNWVHKGAGLERNTKIAEQCDILIAVVAEDRTGGTEDTISKCEALGKPVYIV